LTTRFGPEALVPAGQPTSPVAISSAPMSQAPPRASASMSELSEQLNGVPAFWAALVAWM
jgi:hypothetical protein